MQDDFFYYLKVGQNLAAGRGSTFNGLVLTNGYHPLWLLTIAAIAKLGQGELWLGTAVMLVTFAAIGATAWITARIFRQFGIGFAWSIALALFSTLASLTLFYCGMEVTLTIPLALGAMLFFSRERWEEWSLLAWAGGGLLLSATILSRLDSALFVMLLFAGFLLSGELRACIRSRQVAGLALGLAPVLVYLLVNHHVFGVWMPVSGMAKELRFTRVPSREPLGILFGLTPMAHVRLLPIVVGLALYAGMRRRFAAAERVVLLAALLFPVVHIVLLSVVSDWLLWPWYLYPLRISFVATVVLLARTAPGAAVLRRLWLAPAVCGLAVVGVLATKRVFDQETAMVDVAKDLVAFSTSHPGIYAMGDRSGVVGYLLPAPLVQTEGLMMDRAFVERIRAQTPLREVLRAYHVRYYVATVHGKEQPCFHAVEPWQAGPTSPHMVSDFCEAPVATFSQRCVSDTGL